MDTQISVQLKKGLRKVIFAELSLTNLHTHSCLMIYKTNPKNGLC